MPLLRVRGGGESRRKQVEADADQREVEFCSSGFPYLREIEKESRKITDMEYDELVNRALASGTSRQVRAWQAEPPRSGAVAALPLSS